MPGPRPALPAPSPLTIRKTLLLACLLVGLLPSMLLALLAFDRVSGVLRNEIEQGLQAQAEAVGADLTKLMYERLQNAATWRRIEVMQDLQVGDVDKRLSGFLERLAAGYGGLYRELAAVDRQGRVVAASRPAGIGEKAAGAAALRHWQAVTLAGTPVSLALPQTVPGDDGASLVLRTPIPSAFGGGDLGELQLRMDWSQVDRRLDEAANAGPGGRLVALLDNRGRMVAGSRRLLELLPRLTEDLAAHAAPAADGGAAAQARPPLPGALGEPMLVGVGRAHGYAGFDGFGWQLLVLVPLQEALAPVRSTALVFAVLLGGVALLTIAVAFGVSRAIARPIVALTEASRNYRRARALPQPAAAPSGEVAELGSAFVEMVRDIEQSQQQLARATALAAVGEMSAVIAHEVRTPLGVMLSSAQILQREPQLSSEGRELAGFIESETARLSRLISAMLEGARPRDPAIAPTDMNALVHHASALLAAQAARQGVTIQTHGSGRETLHPCDEEQMTQVLLNLLLNGLQILEHGGRIVVSLREEPQQLVIDIADDGPGIAPEARARIFEAFFFQREGGIGLGLAGVQKVVTAHGGRIEAGESELGGALFRILLPREGPAAAAAEGST